jgi:hypothetical protein
MVGTGPGLCSVVGFANSGIESTVCIIRVTIQDLIHK